jgi:hypothetical protein
MHAITAISGPGLKNVDSLNRAIDGQSAADARDAML